MSVIHGFRLKWEQDVHELKIKARFFRHEKTGAELLSLSSDDENKVFGITFRTPPPDSKGTPHILEHSVLCGSRKYPVKEPFVELIKSSLSTFLNAFTYPDKTCYPVASQNIQDFYNLIDVYLDAVFYPRLTPYVLQQEGWHLELEAPDKELSYKGVVYNEMKGAYSSPENVLSEQSVQSLFPDNAYSFDSGGDPKKIPGLTFDQFLAFHRRYYHPSNARLYFYGDDDPEFRLKIANEYLKDFDAIQPDSAVLLQKPFSKPTRIVRPFMIGDSQGEEGIKGMITLNWLLPETVSAETNFTFRILEQILLGMPASPLRKAMIESGLGEDLAGEGLGTQLRQLYFSTGLKGCHMKNMDQIEALIIKTLEKLAHEGIDPLTVEAALNKVDFSLSENNTGHLPRGLNLMLRSLTTWLYDGDPLALLTFESHLETIKESVASGKKPFEKTIARFLLQNPHRTTLILEPDPGLRQKEEKAEKAHLDSIRSTMSPEELEKVVESTHQLRRLQETPDTPEALATIPVLKLSDLDRKNKSIPCEYLSVNEVPLLFHALFTNGIVYLDVGFDLHCLPDKFLPYVPLFGRALVEMGTDKESFVSLNQRINRATGGIHPQVFTSSLKAKEGSAAWLFLRGKAMADRSEELVGIISELLLNIRLDDQERFRQMVMEEKARAEEKLIPGGHQVVNMRLRSHFTEAYWIAEQLDGVSNLFFLRDLARSVRENWTTVLDILLEMRHLLINSSSMILNITLDRDNWSSFRPYLNSLLDNFPDRPVTRQVWSPRFPSLAEGLTVPTQVNYVGKGADLNKLGYRFKGSALPITRYIRNTWLWDRIRVQGGAYGAFCMLDRLSGVLSFVSYRDPNLEKTLQIYDRAADYLLENELSSEELKKSIIGAIGDLDMYMLPDTKGYTSMLRFLTNDSEEDRQKMRDEILATTKEDFKDFAQVLAKVQQSKAVKVLGSPEGIETAVAGNLDWLDVIKVL